MVPAMKQKLLLFVVFILSTVLSLNAQRDTASLEGRAVDSGGAVVPLAAVELEDDSQRCDGTRL